MADEYSISKYLEAAHKQGLLVRSRIPNICLVKYINTANRLLWYLGENQGNGMNNEQLAKALNFNMNTSKIYSRVLHRLGYLEQFRGETIQYSVVWRLNPKKFPNLESSKVDTCARMERKAKEV